MSTEIGIEQEEKGVRGTLKRPYDMNKWNKKELLIHIKILEQEIAHLRLNIDSKKKSLIDLLKDFFGL